MSMITVGTAFNIDLEFATAPLVRRMGAVILDMFVLLLYMILVYRFIIIAFDIGSNMNQLALMMSISILPFLYFPITEILLNGQTPGKRLLGLKVMDLSGKEASISQYLLRWLVGFGNYSVFLLPYIIANSSIEILAILLFFAFVLGMFYAPDFLSVVISNKKQRLADLAAGTVVIDLRKKTNINETIFIDLKESEQKAIYPEVMKLSDKDINGIKNLLNNKSSKKDDWVYRASIVQKICAALHIEAKEESDIAFLEQLLRDYNYLTQRK